MTPTTKKIIGLTATVVVLLGTIGLWHISHKSKNPLVGTTDQGDAKEVQNVGDFDQFQQDLATRVLDKFGAGTSGSDFSVMLQRQRTLLEHCYGRQDLYRRTSTTVFLHPCPRLFRRNDYFRLTRCRAIPHSQQTLAPEPYRDWTAPA
jgi:hypothetical protein